MTRLEHANIVVTQIEPTLKFLQTAFPHWTVRGGGEDDWFGKPRKWLHFGDDRFFLTLNDNGEGAQRDRTGHQPGLAHIGFEVSSIAEIEKRLGEAGYEPHVRGPEEPGRRNIYYLDPEGLEFEFVEYLSDDPEIRNAYS